ncbi:hypothetical protein, partial [Pseudomonas syringae]|uniref:hypothetical protein n=1 Tax=Pseudomonas syringae TaxID=317 RepID=UPI001CA4A233
FAACLLALAGIFEIGKAHLAHGRLGSGGQAYFITSWDLFGDSLGVSQKNRRIQWFFADTGQPVFPGQ